MSLKIPHSGFLPFLKRETNTPLQSRGTSLSQTCTYQSGCRYTSTGTQVIHCQYMVSFWFHIIITYNMEMKIHKIFLNLIFNILFTCCDTVQQVEIYICNLTVNESFAQTVHAILKKYTATMPHEKHWFTV